MSAAKRQDLRALIENPPEPPPAPPASAPATPPATAAAAPADAAEPGTAAPAESSRPRQRPRKAKRRPAAELVTPAREAVPREALKADVPTELALIRRLHLYRLDHGVDIRDQVAIAVDEWLESRGY